jgi:hypothetical protein
MAKDVGGITIGELINIVGGFLVDIRKEYTDDHKLSATEIIECFLELFEEIADATDDQKLAAIANSIATLLSAVLGLLPPDPDED